MATKVVVRHFHEGNDADRSVRGPKAAYATVARVISLDTGEVVSTAILTEKENTVYPCEVWAFCSKKDIPSRSNGRMIALGRLQRRFPEQCKAASFGNLEHLRK
jgi:hypothetical protein